jgi:hypothetical protein
MTQKPDADGPFSDSLLRRIGAYAIFVIFTASLLSF